jgi:DNA-binding HxlR family transcriptional regulator
MTKQFRCSCPVTSALDILGDKWTLALIKLMVLEGRKTFKDFLESKEAIASNILSARLKMLENFNIITKNSLPHNRKTNIYLLTEKGLDLTPTLVELTLWSDRNIRDYHSTLMSKEKIAFIRNNKQNYIESLIENYIDQNKIEKAISKNIII